MNQKLLKELVSYDPIDGLFRWNKPRPKCTPGKTVGTITKRDGYVRVGLLRKIHLAHRLAFFYMTGKWPKEDIDHVNGIRHDNRWKNIREATRSQNNYNTGLRSNNTSGCKGVFRRRNGWCARINVDGKAIHLGDYETFEEARDARLGAASIHHGDFVNVG